MTYETINECEVCDGYCDCVQEFGGVVARLTDSYDAACEAYAERERQHTLYRLSELIAQVNAECGIPRMPMK